MNENTLLLRQIHPSFVKQGRVTSQAFRPTPKDENCLSVYDGDMISSSNAFQHYTSQLGHSSVGVMAVSCAECSQLELPTRSDPEPFPEHALIDFTAFSASQIEKKAKRLKAHAEARGWKHQA